MNDPIRGQGWPDIAWLTENLDVAGVGPFESHADDVRPYVAADSFDQLLTALQGEVKRLRYRPHAATQQGTVADRPQSILDTYGGGER